jgi:hypothetical protein
MAQTIGDHHRHRRPRDAGGDKAEIDRDIGLSGDKWVAALGMIGRGGSRALQSLLACVKKLIPIAKMQ